jgi:hypothetical protein
VQASDAVGQILSNYQAAVLLLDEAVGDATVSRETAREIFEPVLDACGGAVPGLDELVAEVIADPGRVAATHSRLIKRRPALKGPAPAQLSALVTGSHSAGALFKVLLARR